MRVLETALYAPNLAETAAFYRDVLDLEAFLSVAGRHVFFRIDGGVLLLFNPDATETAPTDPAMPVPTHGARGQGHLCFAASGDEIDGWVARLTASDVAIEADFRWPNGARSIYFRDPAGNSLEFAEPAIWGL